MQASSEITDLGIWVDEEIGAEGWKTLEEGLRLHPGLLLRELNVSKDYLREERMEDIRVMWDALETGGWIRVELASGGSYDEQVWKTEGEAGLTRLTQIMEMSKEEWAAQLREREDAENW